MFVVFERRIGSDVFDPNHAFTQFCLFLIDEMTLYSLLFDIDHLKVRARSIHILYAATRLVNAGTLGSRDFVSKTIIKLNATQYWSTKVGTNNVDWLVKVDTQYHITPFYQQSAQYQNSQ